MWVKICANTNLADAQLAAELGADAVGFVFAPSQRRVTAGQVAAITPHLPGSVLTAGVFGLGEAASLVQIVRDTGLQAVQLHMPYDAAFVRELTEAFEGKVELWQVVSYELGAQAEDDDTERAFALQLRAAMHDAGVAAVLLDAARGGASGGLGLSLPWGRIASFVRSARLSSREAGQQSGPEPPRVILAGGLRAETVGEAIRSLQPDGVDVASGVEAEPGRKSPEKLQAFLAAARAGSL